jgi:SAM-dependent methyltransferase
MSEGTATGAAATEGQQAIDARNAAFWDELCGSALARQLGIEGASPQSLARFDEAYMALYPYLSSYLPQSLAGAEVLEIGLGYGTLSSQLIARGASYHGADIADGPVQMVRQRLRMAGLAGGEEARVRQASALELPWEAGRFDYVFTIGCLHHTGNTPLAVSEVHRVLRPGGTAVVMLYNAHSFRQLLKVRLPGLLRRARSSDQKAAMYDTNAAGEAAPHVEYFTRAGVRGIFSAFSNVDIDVRNFDNTRFVPRERLLGNVDRVLGLDLYITARK